MSIKEIFTTMDYGTAPESTKMATQWLAERENKLSHFINGEFVVVDGDSLKAQNPATGEALYQLPKADQATVDTAVKAATSAQTKWQALSGFERANYLYAIARQIQKHSRLFSVLESLDNGKTIRETRDIDIPLVIRHFYHHAGWAQLANTELADYQAVGVVGQIIPWNFPLLMLAWKVAPALAMGNTIVLKPAEYTSATAVLFAQICQQVGLPKGVFNLVLGDGETGEHIVNHSDINKIAFTGSTQVGQAIHRATAGSGKKLSLELGGKSAFIVFEDADIDSAIEGIVDAIWFNQGQVCCAGSRLLIQESIEAKFIDKLKARMQTLALGAPQDKNTDIGAIVDPSQLERITSLVQQGVAQGAELFQAQTNQANAGCFYPATLLTNVEPADMVAQTEIFGPVLVAMSFRHHSEAIQIANNSRYGLAASIWSENINLALDVAPQIQAGTVWINSTNLFDANVGFGGLKESGFGREGGKEGLFEYVKPVFTATESKTANKAKTSSKVKHQQSTIDSTAKLYIGGKQVRPDSGYSFNAFDAQGNVIAALPDGSRKDIRNAVEACNKAASWSTTVGHNRAQIIYFIAENLAQRKAEFVQRLLQVTGDNEEDCNAQFDTAIERIFIAAAWADKFDGTVHQTPSRIVAMAMKQALGNIAIVTGEHDGFIAMVTSMMHAIAAGNRVILVPHPRFALLATDLYQILNTSDVPAGVINIITGEQSSLVDTLAKHFDLQGIWYWGDNNTAKAIELLSADSMKRTWVNQDSQFNWQDKLLAQHQLWQHKATEIQNIWVPYGA